MLFQAAPITGPLALNRFSVSSQSKSDFTEICLVGAPSGPRLQWGRAEPCPPSLGPIPAPGLRGQVGEPFSLLRCGRALSSASYFWVSQDLRGKSL